MSTRILIVDDHEIVRSGLRRLVETQSGWEVCGEAGNGKEAIEKALALKPDLVLIDITMPVIERYRGHPADTPTISSDENRDRIDAR